MDAYKGVKAVEAIDSIGDYVEGLADEDFLNKLAETWGEHEIDDDLPWNFLSEGILESIESVQAKYKEQQGVYIAIKITWQKCEETDWPGWSGVKGVPFTFHLDWIQHKQWNVNTSLGDSGVTTEGFDLNDTNGIAKALPSAIFQSLQAVVR